MVFFWLFFMMLALGDVLGWIYTKTIARKNGQEVYLNNS